MNTARFFDKIQGMKRILALCFVFGGAACAVDVSDVKVRVLDGFGGDTGSVASFCQTRAGAPYDPATVTRDVSALSQSGDYEQVNADVSETSSGVEVVFYVKRKMVLREKPAVEGAGFFSASRIASEANLKTGYRYGQSDFATAAASVRQLYNKKHFPDAKVTPVVDAGTDGSCTLKFIVDEGQRMKLRDILFVGADSVDEDDLRKAIDDYPWWNPVGWFADAPVTAAQQEECVEKLAKVYRDAGYLDVKVDGPVRQAVGEDRMDILYKFVEGPQYKVGRISVDGLTRYPAAAVLAKSEVPEPGSIAGEKALQDAAHSIEIAVGSGDLGLADSHVDVRRIGQEGDPTVVDLVFKVTEGVPVVLNDVKIRGNDYTMDKVIRREISLAPGDRMLADRADRSRKRLEQLDYFSRVSYKLEPTGLGKDAAGNEYRDLVYEVEEKNTGSFMVGVGASSVDYVFVSAELQQNNFDIFAPHKYFRGGGQRGRVFVQAGPRIQSYEASVTEPHLFGRFLEFEVEGYRRNRWYDEYDIIRSGAAASLSYPVKFWPTWNPFGRLGLRFSGEYIEFDDVDRGEWIFAGQEVSLKEEERLYGEAVEPVLRLFWGHDSRDDRRMPKSGSRTQLFGDVAPGGDNKYWRLGAVHRSYFNVWKRFGHVLMAGVRAETIDGLSDEVPIYNRMFLGGPKSIRGIEYRNVAPFAKRDEDGRGGIPWGGQTLFCANFEYTVPIVKMLRLAAFTDLGSVGVDEFDADLSDTFAWTVGLGVRLDIPMFPIRLDFGTPIEKPDDADKEVFSFTVGYDF